MREAKNEPIAGALLAEARDVFDVEHQFHGDLSGLNPLCGRMDHYICPAILCYQLNDPIAGETKHFEAKMLFVEGNRPLYVAGIKKQSV